ncbi:MAG: CBS domain-containing protein [Anaerolineae bacterium]
MAQTGPQILYLSALVGRPVRGASGEMVGKLTDLVVRMHESETFPPLSGLVTTVPGRRGFRFFIHISDIAEITRQGVRLKTDKLDLAPFARRDSEVLLGRDVLDKQLVDINGRRVIRVNDVTLTLDPVSNSYRVGGADVSTASLLERLGLRGLARNMTHEVIPWDSVQFFASEVPVVKLKLSYDKLARLHPVELAEIINDLGYQQGGEMIAALADIQGDAVAADTVEELDPELQAAVIGTLSVEDAADILEEMEPDEAADLLSELPAEQAEDLLQAMEAEDAADVRELLQYEEDTAGGLMSNDYVAFGPEMTVGEALAQMRHAELPEFVYYIYVCTADEALAGVISLRTLLLANDAQPLGDLMSHADSLITANVGEPARDVAEEMIRYNLLAMPVIEDGKLVGIIHSHDALERVLPEPGQSGVFGGNL